MLVAKCSWFAPDLSLQERLWLCALDDGEQLGPLSPQVKEGDRGFTAAWGRLHGTQVCEITVRLCMAGKHTMTQTSNLGCLVKK